eukprot:12177435-Karenia_brevis.AAC.1
MLFDRWEKNISSVVHAAGLSTCNICPTKRLYSASNRVQTWSGSAIVSKPYKNTLATSVRNNFNPANMLVDLETNRSLSA